MTSNSSHFRPRFDVHGLQSYYNSFNVANQIHVPPQFFPKVYPANNNRPPLRHVFQHNNPHINGSINFSSEHIHQNVQMPITFVSEAPVMPRDPEMLRNIDILSSYVIKHGSSFEKMTQEKEANNPKFGFLFDSDPGTEAAIGKLYYEWKKNALQATFHPQHHPQEPISSSNRDCGESQTLPFASNCFCNSQARDAKKETYNLPDQDSVSSGGIDMDIEGMHSTLLLFEYLTDLKSICVPYSLKT